MRRKIRYKYKKGYHWRHEAESPSIENVVKIRQLRGGKSKSKPMSRSSSQIRSRIIQRCTLENGNIFQGSELVFIRLQMQSVNRRVGAK